ncbi:hypothetical protein FACS1894166_09110 [Bacilli bacterium]|nr:hypothetical protein FACS1894166_09110 [Bacilli bacterium]
MAVGDIDITAITPNGTTFYNYFHHCASVTSFVVGGDAVFMGDEFVNCLRLTAVTATNKITEIQDYAFSGDKMLHDLYLLGNNDATITIGNKALNKSASYGVVHTLAGGTVAQQIATKLNAGTSTPALQ